MEGFFLYIPKLEVSLKNVKSNTLWLPLLLIDIILLLASHPHNLKSKHQQPISNKIVYIKVSNTADLILEVSSQGSAAKIKIAESIATTPKSLSGTDLKIA